jgi:hypothetical protein
VLRTWNSGLVCKPGAYARRPSGRLPFPLGEPTCAFFAKGRHALWHGVRGAGLGGRGDEILVPAFNCGSEIEALVRAELMPRFYKATETLKPELEVQLEEQIARRDDETTTQTTSGGAQIKLVGIGGGVDRQRAEANTTGETKTHGRTRPMQPAVKQVLERLLPVIVIDDFHYIDQPVQRDIVRGHLVAVEAHVERRLPSLTLTGLPGAGV